VIGDIGGRRRLLHTAAAVATGLGGLAGRAGRAGMGGLAGLGGAALAGLAGRSGPALGANVPDDVAPAAWPTLRLLDGSVLSPDAFEGLAVVLVVWATWCPYCHRHNPRVEALHRAVAGRPMRVLGASLDVDPELVRRHVRERGYTFPITMDADLLRSRFDLRRVTPMTVTFDRRGRILQRIPGEMAEADVMGLARLAETPI
jgi:thiol-disulfide isomerase/thioredoxin